MKKTPKSSSWRSANRKPRVRTGPEREAPQQTKANTLRQEVQIRLTEFGGPIQAKVLAEAMPHINQSTVTSSLSKLAREGTIHSFKRDHKEPTFYTPLETKDWVHCVSTSTILERQALFVESGGSVSYTTRAVKLMEDPEGITPKGAPQNKPAKHATSNSLRRAITKKAKEQEKEISADGRLNMMGHVEDVLEALKSVPLQTLIEQGFVPKNVAQRLALKYLLETGLETIQERNSDAG